MTTLLIYKELKTLFYSERFILTYAISALLILLSIHMGLNEYKSNLEKYNAAQQLLDQDMRERGSWNDVSTRAYRKPDPLQIFVTGTNNDIGRFSAISQWEQVKLQGSSYSHNPVFAVFRHIDFAFIIHVIMSLITILFTYNAINGERETGTLKLVLSHNVPRLRLFLAKLAGNWLGLMIPLLIPVLLGLLFVMLSGIRFSAEDWWRVFLLLFLSVLYLSFFIALGTAVSAATRHSIQSFLVLLVCWVGLVLIIPRVGTMAAARMIPVPSVAEIESRREAFEKSQWKKHEQGLVQRWRERNALMAGMTAGEREAFEEANMWSWMEEEDRSRKSIQEKIAAFSMLQAEDMRNRRQQVRRLGYTFSRFSPAASYLYAAASIAGTDPEMKARYESRMQDFQAGFHSYVSKKQQQEGGNNGIRIEMDSEKGFSFSGPDLKETIDVSDLPRFREVPAMKSMPAAEILLDISLLCLFSMISFAAGYFLFLRYDVR